MTSEKGIFRELAGVAIRPLGHTSVAFLSARRAAIDGLTTVVRKKRLGRRVDGHFEGVAR
jgi:hypothetical protein